MQIANTILAQLGGNRFIVMTGAKNMFAMERGLTMTIGKNNKKVNRVSIKLNDRDLYDIRFCRYSPKTFQVTDVSTATDVYAEDLRRIFTAHTEMYVSL